MTSENGKEGTAETLRGVLVIVIVGALLGVGFNALGLASHPPRGLSWITKVEKMPSLEELQPTPEPAPPAGEDSAKASAGGPAADVVRPAAPAAGSGSLLVLAVVVPPQVRVALTAAADSAHGGRAKATATATTKTTAAKKAVAKKAATKKPAPALTKTAVKPSTPASAPAKAVSAPAAASRAPAQGVAKVDLPVVPDLNQPIEVKLPNVKKFFDAGAAIVVDAREAPEYADGHIKGALSVPFDDAVAKPALLEPFKKVGKPIIIYCSGGDCELSKNLANNMLAAGIHKVLVFTDGYPAWKAAGYPVETGAGEAGH
jgi:rhodanese-related sulfurtransferase